MKTIKITGEKATLELTNYEVLILRHYYWVADKNDEIRDENKPFFRKIEKLYEKMAKEEAKWILPNGVE